MEKLDEEEVPDFDNNEHADAWYKNTEAKQKQAFNDLLKDFAKKEVEVNDICV